ncbi:hypothetical protein EKO27_g3186 [Xylaria grammica]|uniref:2-isopropylmalate synthase n=1 Tax=Xylaria grammica TaxID=363999 RepID=A0A439DBW6_9PEZI|nr:hypothetical protein EKO27_g3186 [Xylaria grammica]
MNTEAKMHYFQALVKLGYKEIEISYPSASEVEWNFTRQLIGTPGVVPEDVRVQVMAPCREDLIRQTIESVRGARSVIVHLHLSTSECFQKIVFGLTEKETTELAVRCTKLVRSLTKESSDREMREIEWTLEFTPENFQDTTPEYGLEICEAVKDAWQPRADNPIIFNLAATVEVAMPNMFADQIEYFCTNISDRELVCVSLHNHNDRGCAVAATELGLLAGADRVEGCLFGNGERTGNVDLVTLAMNLKTQGIPSGIDFSNINEVVAIVEKHTAIPVHKRAPYAGAYTFCTFSGTHQDAIRKGYSARAALQKGGNEALHWQMPYLAMDPSDLGREHEAIVRINSQCGKSGIGWVVNQIFGIKLPRELEVDFTSACKAYATAAGCELTHAAIEDLFRMKYMRWETVGRDRVPKIRPAEGEGDHQTPVGDVRWSNGTVPAPHGGQGHKPTDARRIQPDDRKGIACEKPGSGNSLVLGLLGAVQTHKVALELLAHQSQHIDHCASSKRATLVKLGAGPSRTAWGVGIHALAETAALHAVRFIYFS